MEVILCIYSSILDIVKTDCGIVWFQWHLHCKFWLGFLGRRVFRGTLVKIWRVHVDVDCQHGWICFKANGTETWILIEAQAPIIGLLAVLGVCVSLGFFSSPKTTIYCRLRILSTFALLFQPALLINSKILANPLLVQLQFSLFSPEGRTLCRDQDSSHRALTLLACYHQRSCRFSLTNPSWRSASLEVFFQVHIFRQISFHAYSQLPGGKQNKVRIYSINHKKLEIKCFSLNSPE